MSKLILAPLALLVLPQSVVWSWWFLLRCMGLDSPECRIFVAVISFLVVLVFGGLATGFLLESWIPEYARERKDRRDALESERERMRREFDELVGIPRIPVKR